MQRQKQPDAELGRRVKDALMARTDSAGVDVQVEVRPDGTVRLHGIVDTLSQARAAAEIARQVPGVGSLDNDLTVHGEKSRTDEWIRRAVGERLARNGATAGMGAEVTGGAVTLVGHAPTAGAEAEAVRMAQGVPGVTDVRSRVKVGENREDDDALVARQARLLLSQMGLDPARFTLWCDAGTLHVRGLVDSVEQADRIRRMLARLDGVAGMDVLLPPDPGPGVEVPTGRGGKDVH